MTATAQAETKSQRILLVEDDPTLARARAAVLLTNGYDVEHSTFDAADDHCRRTAPDLVLVALAGDRAHATFRLLGAIHKFNRGQRIGFLLHPRQQLCSVSFNGELVRKSQGPDDLLHTVASLLPLG